MLLTYEWVDRGRDPQCPPDPMFPNGKPIDASCGAIKTCTVDLPHPAKRCGYYVVECKVCRLKVAITTAGRPDDPSSLKVACKSLAQ